MTTFYALFQGDHDDHESDATLLAVFSTEKLANEFMKTLDAGHTAMKKSMADLRERRLLGFAVDVPDVPDLYWDIRPVVFDPRDEGEL